MAHLWRARMRGRPRETTRGHETMVKKACLPLLIACAVCLAALGDYQEGISYYKQGQYAKAIAEFKQILKTHPNYEDGYRILGDCYLKTKEYDQAVEAFRSALRLKTNVYASYYGLALAYYNSGRYQEALSILLRGEHFARSPVEKYQLYHTRGAAYYNSKDFSKAVSDLEKAISIKRGNVTDVLQIAIAYYQLQAYTQAEKYLNQALALDPDASAARRYLSQISHRQAIEAMEANNYTRAATILRKHLKRNGEDAEAWFNLGLSYLFLGNLKGSEQAFLTTVKFMPENGKAYNRLGFISEKTKRYRQALQYYKQALDLTRDVAIKESLERVKERIRRRRAS